MYPHYFEKQQTDGVDYQMYVGASLKEDGAWDPIYLKNLRIWQLMVTCGAARRAHQLRDTLPLPLEITRPGTVAIVYSQASEAQEYRRYIEYLKSLGYFTGEIEDHELEELQGVHGLRALRVRVDLTRPQGDRAIALSDLAQRAN